MIGFSYIYKTSDEVLESVSYISSMWLFDILWVLICLIGVIAFIFFIIPSSIIIHEYHQEKKAKKSKKSLLTQILLQKEIEDEVEKEVEIEAESTLT